VRWDQGQLTAASGGLDRHPQELAVDPLQLPGNPQCVLAQGDVNPGEAEDLAPSEAVHEQQGKCRVERVVPGDGEEAAGLVGGPRPVP
jgi:hypothetical protein